MSNADVVNRVYTGFAAGDIGAATATFADDIEWTEAVGFPYAGTYVGTKAIVANLFMRLGTEWDSYQAVPDLMISDGDQVAALGWYSGVYKQTGRPFRAASCIGGRSPTIRSPASSKWSKAARSTKPSSSCQNGTSRALGTQKKKLPRSLWILTARGRVADIHDDPGGRKPQDTGYRPWGEMAGFSASVGG